MINCNKKKNNKLYTVSIKCNIYFYRPITFKYFKRASSKKLHLEALKNI